MLPSTHSGPVYGQCIPDKSAARPQSYGAGNGMGLAHASPCPWSRACRTGLEGTTTDPWPWSKGFFRGRRGGGPAPRDCQHWHSRISLFRWVFFGSSKICKEVLVSFASPTESRGSQWTSKVGQWYQKIPMPALLISRLACNASAAILGVTNCFILSVIDSRGKQKRGFCFVLTNPLQGTTLRCQRLLCIYNADDTHNSEVSWPQVQTQHERWYIKLTLSQLGKKKRKAKKNTSDLYQACLPSINTNIKLAGFVIPLLEIVWYSTRAKQSKAERKSVSKHKLRGTRGRNLLNLERNFQVHRSNSTFRPPVPSPFVFMPHLTSNLQAVASVFIAPTLFPLYPCACASLALQQRVSSKPLKHTPPRKSLYLRLLQIEALIKPLLESPKQAFFCPQKKDLVILSGIK